VKVVNVSPDAQEADVDFSGIDDAASLNIRATVMSGKPDDENSLDQPRKAAPHERELMFAKPSFTYAFPPHSVTVWRVRANRETRP
jgi:alpha-L-arabinofuranosidase